MNLKKGKSMQEIERRFIVHKFSGSSDFPYGADKKYIQQGYFETPVNGHSFRIRITDNKIAELTLKEGKGISRIEIPCPIPVDFADKLIKLCSHKIKKTRYNVGRWEIDFFDPPLNGIVIAEIELSAVNEKFDMPIWMDQVEEVTDSLTSHHLARLATELEDNNFPALPFIYTRGLSSFPLIVITGGPCSGKSSILDLLKKEKPNLQFVPEVATIVISHLNIKPKKNLNKQFQRLIHNAGNLFEVTSSQYAMLEGKNGLILDRGLPDGAAYFDGGVDEYERILKTNIHNEYARYRAVICLDVPPQDIYEVNKINNSARSEDYLTACHLGDKIKKIWKNHPHFIFIGNEGGWDEKVRKVKEAIDKVLR